MWKCWLRNVHVHSKPNVGNARFHDRYRHRVCILRNRRQRKRGAHRCDATRRDARVGCNDRKRPRATRCDFWMNRRVAMTHRSRRSLRLINRARFGINYRSFEPDEGEPVSTRAVTLLYWNSAARVSAFIGSYIPNAVNLYSSELLFLSDHALWCCVCVRNFSTILNLKFRERKRARGAKVEFKIQINLMTFLQQK